MLEGQYVLLLLLLLLSVVVVVVVVIVVVVVVVMGVVMVILLLSPLVLVLPRCWRWCCLLLLRLWIVLERCGAPLSPIHIDAWLSVP